MPAEPEARALSPRAKLAGGAVALAAVAFAVAYVARARPRPAPGVTGAPAASSSAKPARPGARVMFRSVASEPEGAFGRVAMAPIDASGAAGAREVTPLACVRVHFAAGRGVCLGVLDEGAREATLTVFDGAFAPTWSTPIAGLPSRARVSPDGRYGAVTVFVTGHSYDDGTLSTRTAIVDLEKHAFVVDDLEKLAVVRDGAPFEAPERNFWGVTFAPEGPGFHATLGHRGKHWLVEGAVGSPTLRVLRDGVECPSRSPDGTRIAFKKRIEGGDGIRLHVLELATLRDRPLGEARSVDDQVEWLDDEHVVYKLGADLHALSIAEGARPRVLLEQASSPAVVRR